MKKLIFVVSFIVLSSFLFGLTAPAAKAATVAELQAQIQQLMAQIVALQQQLSQLQPKPIDWCHTFNANLGVGNKGPEVTALQTALQKEGLYQRTIIGNFDEYTASIVVAFQEKYASEILTPWRLTRGTGYVGPSTRAKLNKLYGCGVVKPYIKVLSPNGGEQLVRGSTYTVKWESKGVNLVRIYIFNPNISGSGSTNYIVSNNQTISASQGYYNWIIGEVGLPAGVDEGAVYKVRIDDVNSSLSDSSDNYFSIGSTTTFACTDSDGGKNYYTKGTITELRSGQIYTYTDFCYPGGSVLAEYFCPPTREDFGVLEDFICPYGCKDGACLSSSTPSITVTYPTTGETLQKGNSTLINLQFFPSVPKGGFVVNLIRSDSDVAVSHLKYCGTTGYAQDSAMPINVSWAWRVGYGADGKEIPNGSYRIFIYDCGDKTDSVWTGNTASAKSNIFNIVSATTPTCPDWSCGHINTNYLSILQKYDKDGNGQINMSEHLAAVNGWQQGNITHNQMCAIQNAWQKGCKFTTVLLPPCDNYGDVNQDGKLDPSDASAISYYIAGLKTFTAEQKLRADVNQDQQINILDSTMISQYLAEQIAIIPACYKNSPCGTYGDINNNGWINLRDADLISKYIAGTISLTDAQKKNADVNGDGNINVLDLTLVVQYVTEGIDTFPVCGLAGYKTIENQLASLTEAVSSLIEQVRILMGR